MPGKQKECEGCGNMMRSDNLRRHQASICKGRMLMNTVQHVNNHYRPEDGNAADALINKMIDGESTPKKRRLDFDDLSENSEQESDDSTDIQFLPGDIEELQDCAKQILKEFGNGKYDCSNELVTILDNLKASQKITETLMTISLQNSNQKKKKKKMWKVILAIRCSI